MKKILILILTLFLFVSAFSGTTITMDLYVPSDLSTADALTYIKAIGGVDEINYITSEPVDGQYQLLRYEVVINGKINDTNVKMVLYYPNGEGEDFSGTGVYLDEEYRYLVGEVDSDNSSVTNRTYITYDNIASYEGGNNGIPAKTEYNPGGSVSIIAVPIYDSEAYDSDSTETFMNGNVITHIFQVVDSTSVVFPELKNSNGKEAVVGSSDTWGELIAWIDANVVEDSNGNGVPDVNEDVDATNNRNYSSDIEYEGDYDDTTYAYFRSNIEVRKYVFFQSGTATAGTPPNSLLEGLEIKSRTGGSNRQRSSVITVGAEDYINDVKDSDDPNPFKITEMEERGIN
jgi:hypothetical protein